MYRYREMDDGDEAWAELGDERRVLSRHAVLAALARQDHLIDHLILINSHIRCHEI